MITAASIERNKSGEWPREAIRLIGSSIGFLVVTASTLAFFAATFVVQGYTVPPLAYLFLSNHVAAYHMDRVPEEFGPSFDPRISAPAIRDIAFETYNVRPSAREWMSKLPIVYAEMEEWGRYDPNTQQIAIKGRYLPVLLHEYAHANFDRKSLFEKLGFMVALVRLEADSGVKAERAKAIVSSELATAIDRAKLGYSYNAVLESYAHLAEASGGDLNQLPDELRGFYADYLQAGANYWTMENGKHT